MHFARAGRDRTCKKRMFRWPRTLKIDQTRCATRGTDSCPPRIRHANKCYAHFMFIGVRRWAAVCYPFVTLFSTNPLIIGHFEAGSVCLCVKHCCWNCHLNGAHPWVSYHSFFVVCCCCCCLGNGNMLDPVLHWTIFHADLFLFIVFIF